MERAIATLVGEMAEMPGAGADICAERISVSVFESITDVEATWRALTASSVESPGQSYDFVRLWIEDRKIASADQRFVVGHVDGMPVALLPLHRKRVYGLPVFTWFPGAHVGCYAPVADPARLSQMGPDGRRALWAAMTTNLRGADVVYLRSIPEQVGGFAGLFDELGSTLSVETVYRTEFTSWEECDKLQRSKSRRKHDRQQGDRLNALGAVEFEALRNGDDTKCAIETMFKQRAARFRDMGVRDPFADEKLTGFYHDLARAGSGVDVTLHLMRLEGQIVAVRYNIVQGERMFCLISSMSDDPAIQGGSPGKQCLLRVMQTIFHQGYRSFDMGSGFTDEKRHWCNVQIPLRQHYVGLTPQGALIVAAHRAFQKTRARVKGNAQLKAALRNAQQTFDRLTGRGKAAEAPSE